MGGTPRGTGAEYCWALAAASWNAACRLSHDPPTGRGAPVSCSDTTTTRTNSCASTSSGAGTRSQRSNAPLTATTIAITTRGPMNRPHATVRPFHDNSAIQVVKAATRESTNVPRSPSPCHGRWNDVLDIIID